MRKRQANKIVKRFFQLRRSKRLLWKEGTIDRAFQGTDEGQALELWRDSIAWPVMSKPAFDAIVEYFGTCDSTAGY